MMVVAMIDLMYESRAIQFCGRQKAKSEIGRRVDSCDWTKEDSKGIFLSRDPIEYLLRVTSDEGIELRTTPSN